MLNRTLPVTTLGLLCLAVAPANSFDIQPAQPDANTTYQFVDVYTLPGGVQKSVTLNPAGVEELILGGTDTFLATLRSEFPDWTFTSADSDLEGSFNVQNSYACGTGTLDCGTERAVPSTVVGSFIDITYTPDDGDPTAAANDLHWIQRLISNHALGAGGGHGVNVDKIDNDSGQTEPDLGDCDDVPYYDCGYFAGETFFVDRPSRTGDSENNHVWSAELYLVEQTAAETVTVYNGVRWGWQNTDSDVRALTAPPSSIRFENPDPPVGGGTTATGIGSEDITWGDAIPTSFASSLSITPNALDLTPLIGEPFVLGTITYANGTIRSGSGLGNVDLIVETSIDVPDLDITALSIEDSREVSMINTLNTCDADTPGDCTAEEARESADYVSIPPASDLADIPAEYPNFSELGNNFHVLEESSATATLIGRITEVAISAAGGDGLLPPGPGAPAPGVRGETRLVWQILGFGSLLEGDGFITSGQPGISVADDGGVDDDIGVDLPGGGVTGGGVTVAFGDDPKLTRNTTAMLDGLVRVLRRQPDLVVDVTGFSVATGSPGKDQQRSLEHAHQVERFLLERGIDGKRIRVSALGSKHPVASNQSKTTRASNNRAEIEIHRRADDPKGRSVKRQFAQVMAKYPAVAQYIVESDAILEFYVSLDLLDGDLLDLVELSPEATRRLQDAVRLSQCLNAGLDTCYRAECSVDERECDMDCERLPNEFQQALCNHREQECRADQRLNCRFVPEHDH